MPLGLQLGVNQLAVDGHLEAATFGRNEGQALDQVLELLEQFPSQANGPVSVVSDCTVDDLDLEHEPSRGWKGAEFGYIRRRD